MTFGRNLARQNRQVQKQALLKLSKLDPAQPANAQEFIRLNYIIQADLKRHNDGFLLRAKVDD